MKSFEFGQFANDYEYKAAKNEERKAERAKRDERRNPRGRRLQPTEE